MYGRVDRRRGVPRAVVLGVVAVACAALGACGGSSPGLGGAGGKSPTGTRGGSTSQEHAGDSGTPSAGAGQGRTQVVFSAKEPWDGAALERTAALMRKRATAQGIEDVEVAVQGREITVTGPGGSQEPLRGLGVTAELAFRPVVRQWTVEKKNECRSAVPDAPEAFTACGTKDNALTKYLLDPVAVPGTDVSAAKATYDKNNGAGWLVQLEFTSVGAKRFADVTGRLAQQQSPANEFAIVLDDTVLSSPSVNQAITGGEAEISGNFTRASAQELAVDLNTGALPVRLEAWSVTRLPAD